MEKELVILEKARQITLYILEMKKANKPFQPVQEEPQHAEQRQDPFDDYELEHKHDQER